MTPCLSTLIIRCIFLYQKVAPSFVRNCCRYRPSCSQYAILVIRQRGPIRGTLLAFLRILRCVPPFGGADWPEISKENCHGPS
ncbi:MAG: membrane protein insertion efficiency factor YidD [Planctomycetes bacterium]|nr:membrane protein insertion efficiency factor YidD [Planctomycetota bacterium]